MELREMIKKFDISISNVNLQTKEKGEFLRIDNAKRLTKEEVDFVKANKQLIIEEIKKIKYEKEEAEKILFENNKKEAESKIITMIKIKNHSYYKLSMDFGIENQELRDDYKYIRNHIGINWKQLYEEKLKSYITNSDYDDYNVWTNYEISYDELNNIINSSKKELEIIHNEEERKCEIKKEVNEILNLVFETKMEDISYGDNPNGDFVPMTFIKKYDENIVNEKLNSLKLKSEKDYNMIIEKINK